MSDDIDVWLTAADPAPLRRIAALPLPLDDLRGAIVDTRRPVASSRWLSAAVLVAVIVGAAGVLLPRTLRSDHSAAPAAIGDVTGVASGAPTTGATAPAAVPPDVAVSEPSSPAVDPTGLDDDIPRLLLPSPWHTTELEGDLSAENGQVVFTDGDQTIELYWYPQRFATGLIDAIERSDSLQTDVAGHDAFVFDGSRKLPDDSPSPGVVLAYWLDDGLAYEARGRGITPNDADAFAGLLEQFNTADPTTWLAALPRRTVTPAERQPLVDEMVTDIPIPATVDVAALRSAGHISSGHYNVGAVVTSGVACGWIEQWLTATDAGDQRAVRKAVAAMQTSHDWAVLQQMQPEGGWSESVWEYADAMKTGEPIVGGRELTIRESYKDALGCSG